MSVSKIPCSSFAVNDGLFQNRSHWAQDAMHEKELLLYVLNGEIIKVVQATGNTTTGNVQARGLLLALAP